MMARGGGAGGEGRGERKELPQSETAYLFDGFVVLPSGAINYTVFPWLLYVFLGLCIIKLANFIIIKMAARR